MAKNDNLNPKFGTALPELPEQPVETAPKTKAQEKREKRALGNQKEKKKVKKQLGIVRVFKEMWSELKKVEWPPFKRTKNSSGVLVQTGTVLIVVLFFLIFIAAFDSGLLALMRLLTGAAAA